MSRISIAAVAAAAAISLSLSAATAVTADEETNTANDVKQSSTITDEEVLVELVQQSMLAVMADQDTLGSSLGIPLEMATKPGADEGSSIAKDAMELVMTEGKPEGSSWDFLWTTLRSDLHNEWKPGTTMDAIVGTSIAALVLFVLGAGARHLQHQGLIKLPF